MDGGPLQVARRYFHLAEKQFKSGNLDSALASLKRSFDQSTDLASAHALKGEILAAQGKCGEALPSLNRALELEPSNEPAAATLRTCATSGGTSDAGKAP